MLLGVLGDLHGDFDALDRAMTQEPAAAFWLSVGDVAGDGGEYPIPPRPFSFIKGNNEDFDVIARLAAGDSPGNLQLIANGRVAIIDGVRVLGLGGTFAPTWYDRSPEDLSRRSGEGLNADLSRRSGEGPKADLSRRSGGAAKADKRRHFVRAEVEACKAAKDVDLFLSHEAARPYWAGAGRRRNDAGKTPINEILAAVRPRLHLFGHHHRFTDAVREGVRSIGLPLAREGYLVIDADSWTCELRELRLGSLSATVIRPLRPGVR